MLAIPAFSCSGLERIMRLLEVFNEQAGKERRELRWGSCQGSRHPPKSQVPLWKPWLILPKVCFSAPGWFVISGWFCHLLPVMHLIFASFQRWCSPKETHCPLSICSRNMYGLDWHAGWLLAPQALYHLKIHTWVVTVRNHLLCGGWGSHHNLVCAWWLKPFFLLLIFCFLS